ncbi:MAG: hypothetical protein KBC96_05110 [Armatimonadetes bacterium]|nr:hypothetical protein [Armatimonadota bacterium]
MSTACCEPDGVSRSGGNTVYRIDGKGHTVWKYPAPEGWKIGLRDATPAGDFVLVRLISSEDPGRMKLAVLDTNGKPVRSTPMAESNWVWISPDGKHVLRWTTDTASLILELSASGTQVWEKGDLKSALGIATVDFVQPVLQAGFVLVGDAALGRVAGIDIHGNHIFTMNGLNWYPPPASPVTAGNEGRFLAVKSAKVNCTDPFSIDRVSKSGSTPLPAPLESVSDVLVLLTIPQSNLDLLVPGQAKLVWKRTQVISYVPGRRIPRQGAYGGSILALDLLEQEIDGKVVSWLTTLTEQSATTRSFTARGVPDQQVTWPIANISAVTDVLLLTPNLLAVRYGTQPQMLHIVDQTGKVQWDSDSGEKIASVSFTPSRSYMLVESPNRIAGYRLD